MQNQRLLLILGALAALAAALPAAAQPQGIHVSGEGTVEVVPDMAMVTMQISRDGRDAVELKRGLDDTTRAVLKLTRSLKIAAKDVTAAVVNIRPRHRRAGDQTIIDGVTASRTITVVLRELDNYGALLNGALELGVNSVSGTVLDSSRREELELEALEKAMADARGAAERVAQGFDVRVGRLLDVHADQRGVSPQPTAFMMEASRASDFSPGQLRIQRSVRATFAIESR